MTETTVLISRGTTVDREKRAFEDALAELSAKAGLAVSVIPHVYHLAENDALWQELRGLHGVIVCLAWLHPRPIEWILRRHGLRGGAQSAVLTFDMGTYALPEECLRAVTAEVPASASTAGITEHTGKTGERWHPVVDYSRCANCKQCMEFCLFGVYELDDAGKVTVRDPDKCKPGCPACSRICPHGAIMFPLHDDPAIAGAPGEFMTADPALKAMFYLKTKKPCPICGWTYRASLAAAASPPKGAPVCAECGMPLEDNEPDGAAPDDLDLLIDDLEKLR